MLALSNPDPALAFPLGTKLQPQLFLRNTTAKIINAGLRFTWRTAAGATGKAQGPVLRLNPYETRRVDVAALQDGKTLPADANWASVTITTDCKPDELVAVAASYDATLRYGAQTPFSDQLTFRWEGGMWEFDPYHNSIITAGNGGSKPSQAAFTIFYNQGTQRYDLQQTLQPDEQMWIDVGKLIREHVPDKGGKTLPADLTSGSYEFRDLTNTGVGTLFEGKVIYDKTYGHVTYGCGTCCGYYQPKLFFNPLLVPVGSPTGNSVTAYNQCTLTWDDVSGDFFGNWSSANTAIATVNYYGTHTGVSAGSTTSNTLGTVEHYGHRLCPDWQTTPHGGVNVNPTVTIGSFSQDPILQGSTATVQVTVNPSATINLTITGGSSGAAAFNGQGGPTTTTISGTTTVTIYGSAASTNSGDLTLAASYNGTTLIYVTFSVTSGACTVGVETGSGSGPKTCPSTVTLKSTYTISQYCPTCSFTCISVHTDGTWTPSSGCSSIASHVGGSLTGGVTTSATGTFSASDCNLHYAYFVTRVINAQGIRTDDTGASIGLNCISLPNGYPCQ
jgi:hypothetical protein